MSLVIATAIIELNDRLKAFQSGDDPAYDDDELERAIDRAVLEYSLHRPLKSLATINLIAGQKNYSFPSGVVRMFPLIVTDTDAPSAMYAGAMLNAHDFDAFFSHTYESPALIARSETYRAKFYQRAMGTMKVDVAAKKFVVTPAPPTNKTVKVPVVTAYTKATGAYATINAEDVPCILDICECRLLKDLSKAFSSSNMKVGDRDYRGSFTSRDLLAQANELEEKYRARLVLPTAGKG